LYSIVDKQLYVIYNTVFGISWQPPIPLIHTTAIVPPDFTHNSRYRSSQALDPIFQLPITTSLQCPSVPSRPFHVLSTYIQSVQCVEEGKYLLFLFLTVLPLYHQHTRVACALTSHTQKQGNPSRLSRSCAYPPK
jgi:hypothetical protein